MRMFKTKTNAIQKLLFTLLLMLFIFSYANQAYANGKAVDTWYKINSKEFSKTLKAKEVSLVFPGSKSKDRRAKLLIDNRTVFLKLAGENFKLNITVHGSSAKPVAQSAISSTSATNNGHDTISRTTITTINANGSNQTKTKKISGSGTITITITTDDKGTTSMGSSVVACSSPSGD